MGKGLALKFKQNYPDNFYKYKEACHSKKLIIGSVFTTLTDSIPKYIINFPTKNDWKDPSQFAYIESGLRALLDEIESLKIKSISIPALGAGLGGLNWDSVKTMIELAFVDYNIDVIVYEPI
jgi:O-acetyl-ADP-ribose deacetylase (regulator of RNase III)